MDNTDKFWIFLMGLFSKTCHQKSDRSFFFYNYQFPLCARCTGLLIGYISGIIALFFNFKISILVSIIFIAVMFIDWFIQHKKILSSTNIRRFLSGSLCGFAIINILTICFTRLFFIL